MIGLKNKTKRKEAGKEFEMQRKIKQVFSILLAILLVLPTGLYKKTVKAEESYTQIFEVASVEELNAAVSSINSAENGSYLIDLKADLTTNNVSMSFSRNTTTIKGNGHYIQVSVGGGAVVASENATVHIGLEDGSDHLVFRGTETGDAPGVFYVLEGGTVVMNPGVTIQNHKSNNYYGGAVTVEGGQFTMNGGTITNCGIEGGSVCYGGGVAVYAGGIFRMNGGTIDHCYAKTDYIDEYDPNRCFTGQGGGVFITGGSEFIMNDGIIDNNEATNFGGGIALDISYGEMNNSGMGKVKSTVIMNGGTISNNKAANGAGIFASGYFYSYAAPFLGYNPGIGTTSNPGLYMNGGTIDGNIAEEGGGLFIAMLRPNPVQLSDVTICNNEADGGAGLEVYGYWTKTQIDHCSVLNNVATGRGGGVCLLTNSSGGETTISDTEIKGNTSGALGAGVYYDANSALKISGANEIQNNTYNGKQNNLNILNSSKLVTVTGSLEGSKIGISDPTLWTDNLDDTDFSAVSTAKLTSGFETNNTIIPKEAFTSDHTTWRPDYSEDGKEVRLVRKEYHCKIMGGSLTLDGLIGVNLWAYLDDPNVLTEEEISKYSIRFTLRDDTAEGTQTEVFGNPTKYVEKEENNETVICYGFTCDVAATQMADIVHAEIYYEGEPTGVTKDYTVKQYTDNMLEKYEGRSDKEQLENLLISLLNYGAYSQKYFDYKTNNLANVGHEKTDLIENWEIPEKYQCNIQYNGISGINISGLQLEVDEGINIYMKVTLDGTKKITDYIPTLQGDPNQDNLFINDEKETYNVERLPFTDLDVQNNKVYHIILNNMPANRFDDQLTLSIEERNHTENNCEMKFSVMSYCYEMINNGKIDELDLTPQKKIDLKNFLNSLCYYNQFAEIYYANNQYIKDNNIKK